MARRIELPSADVLFGEQQAAPRTPKGEARAKKATKGAEKQVSAAKPKTANNAATAQAPKTAAHAKKQGRAGTPMTAEEPTTEREPKTAARAKKQAPARKPKTAKKPTTAKKPKTAKKPTTARQPKTAARAKKPAPRPRPATLRGATPLHRLEAIESRLGELPVDALIDLRDGLEELLAGDEVDEQAVRRLLDTVEV